jgi:hypothetical protein
VREFGISTQRSRLVWEQTRHAPWDRPARYFFGGVGVLEADRAYAVSHHHNSAFTRVPGIRMERENLGPLVPEPILGNKE